MQKTTTAAKKTAAKEAKPVKHLLQLTPKELTEIQKQALHATDGRTRNAALRKLSAAKKPVFKTKLQSLMDERGIIQAALAGMIYEKYGIEFGAYRISKMATGRLINVPVKTLVLLADVLEVPVGELIETDVLMLEYKKAKK